jgi:hypothetical protein
MKGFGKRVTVAFLSVVALLTVAGVISLFELSNLSYDTSEMLTVTGREVEATKSLLTAVHNHRRAIVDVAVFGDASGKRACAKALKEINSQIASVRSGASASVRASLDTVATYGAYLQNLAVGYSATEKVEKVEAVATVADSTAVATAKAVAPVVEERPTDVRRWFKEKYDPAYELFVKQVGRYATLSHDCLIPHKEQLSKNAYRSVMPVFISLAVMIAIVLMLYYFIYIYAVKPILVMNRSLSDYLSFKLPYKTKASMIDEVKTLNENIEHLINASKSNIKQE